MQLQKAKRKTGLCTMKPIELDCVYRLNTLLVFSILFSRPATSIVKCFSLTNAMFVHEDLHMLASCVVSYLWADRQRFDRFKGSKVQWFKGSKFISNRLRMRNLFWNRLPRGTRSAKSDASSFPHPPSLSASLHANVAPSATGVWISRCRSTIVYQLGKVRWLLHHVLACAVRS